jgi:enamine deaminase RidA (YjgF/YER057c/UK114 family)
MTKQFINPEGLVKPGAYTPVITARGGTLVYVSGQVPLDGTGNVVGGNDLVKQTEQVYRNLDIALKAAGATFEDVVKLNVYAVNFQPADRAALQSVRERYVSRERPPASTLIGVQALARPEFRVEIEAVAVVD